MNALRTRVPARFKPRLRALRRQVVLISYRGTSVYCDCCQRHFRRFLPFGVTPRANARCPGCHSLERHRLIARYLSALSPADTPTSALHIAPEACLVPLVRRITTSYVSADLYDPNVDVQADLEALPFDDQSFDIVMCNHVLEHVPDDRAALRELRRVIRPGGSAILQTPIDPSRATTYEDPTIVDPRARLQAFNQEDHVRVYGRDFMSRVHEAGFTSEAAITVSLLPPDEIRRAGLWPEEVLHIWRPA
jgi:SAM-dependent methyltransferase